MGKHILEPRMLTKEDALYYAGLSPTVFSRLKRTLGKNFDFPDPHPIHKKYDKKLIDHWLDKTGGLKSLDKTLEDELIEKARSGNI